MWKAGFVDMELPLRRGLHAWWDATACQTSIRTDPSRHNPTKHINEQQLVAALSTVAVVVCVPRLLEA